MVLDGKQMTQKHNRGGSTKRQAKSDPRQAKNIYEDCSSQRHTRDNHLKDINHTNTICNDYNKPHQDQSNYDITNARNVDSL